MGKSAPGSALRGFPHAILYRLLTSQGKKEVLTIIIALHFKPVATMTGG